MSRPTPVLKQREDCIALDSHQDGWGVISAFAVPHRGALVGGEKRRRKRNRLDTSSVYNNGTRLQRRGLKKKSVIILIYQAFMHSHYRDICFRGVSPNHPQCSLSFPFPFFAGSVRRFLRHSVCRVWAEQNYWTKPLHIRGTTERELGGRQSGQYLSCL